MKLYKSAQMRELDRYAIETLGIPGKELMTRASEHIADAAAELCGKPSGRFCAVCGTGNNGGDGIGAAAILTERGHTVTVLLVGAPERLTLDSQAMLARLRKAGGALIPLDASEPLPECCVIIDALFGIGLNAPLEGFTLKAVEKINSAPAKVVSADIPSGVHADTGAVLGTAVHADATVTFTAAKPGHFSAPGCHYTGTLLVRDIGIPREAISGCETDTYAVAAGDITLPRRAPDTHKGDYGRCLITGGSLGYTGAAVLAAGAASRVGAGLVYAGVPERIYDITAAKLFGEMPFPLPDDGFGKLSRDALGTVLKKAAECDVLLCGMGLGRSPELTRFVTGLIKSVKIPLILDADGINALEGNIDILDEAACPLILTPHEGEFSRLGGDLTSADRLTAARKFAVRYGCILVLKGSATVTALPNGDAFINTTGGPELSKGGTGDVLAGMIAGFCAQGFVLKDAVLAAVYLHGLAGEICAERLGEYSVSATDVIGALPEAMKGLPRNG